MEPVWVILGAIIFGIFGIFGTMMILKRAAGSTLGGTPSAPSGYPAPDKARSVNPVVLIGAGILVVLIIILIVLMSSKPWESQAYKQCVAEQKAEARKGGIDPKKLESKIKNYCHANYD